MLTFSGFSALLFLDTDNCQNYIALHYRYTTASVKPIMKKIVKYLAGSCNR